ncbi:probable serine/threonine-protein kinase PBL1 [Vicia villosa]|uniref:probable serine/threonine-protein kinase PBL1 n=1 Tax=Vicia villosa TaxID=3911 RepID=UPI00273BEE8A|nr:probable serine/threonine-protein kinase PBL1 [Vicia villosa]
MGNQMKMIKEKEEGKATSGLCCDVNVKAMYNIFSAANIHIDIDFNTKLSRYGIVGHIAEEAFSRSLAVSSLTRAYAHCVCCYVLILSRTRCNEAARNLSVETWRKGKLTPKRNVWSFGIVLLELLTGRKNFDINLPRERKLVKWGQPFLADNLSVLMDSQLEGRFLPKAAIIVAGFGIQIEVDIKDYIYTIEGIWVTITI